MAIRKLTDAERERLRDRWQVALAAETPQRQNEIDDLEFEAGDQWDAAVKQDRLNAGKPCLTMDLTSGPVKQVTNQMRSARPAIVVKPVGNGADVKTAQHWQGILRRIENRSNAEYAYIWAMQHQTKMGRGRWRILPDYISPDSDLVDLKIQWIDNQHTVYLDPSCKEADGSDRRWAFIVEDLTHTEYKARFGGSDLCANLGETFQSLGDAPPEWITKEHVRCVEYYELVEDSRKRHTLSDGSYAYDDELEYSGRGKARAPKLPEGQSIKRSRDITTRTIRYWYTNGVECLDETIIPGSFIPIVEIEGERRNINGKVDRRGMVRMAKDPQRIVNFQESSIQETVSTGTKSRWLIAEGQTEGYEAMWRTANSKNWDALIYKDTSVGGSRTPPPIPIDREPPIQAMTIAAQRAAMTLKQNLGYVDVSSDERRSAGDTVSGKAISARKLQQEMQSSDYMDNAGRGISLTGRILFSMARETYDVPRVLRIRGEDDKEYEIVAYKGEDNKPAAQQLLTEEIKELFDVGVGDFDIVFGSGKSYESQRQEQSDAMERLFGAIPELAAGTADLYVESMDWPNAQKIAARLKKLIPQAQDDDKQQQIPPKVQQRLQALDQFAQAAHDQIGQLTQMIDSKQMELRSKEKIAADDNLTKIQIAQMQLGVQTQIAEMQNHIQKLESIIGVIHETRLAEQQHAHEAGLEAMRGAHAQQQAEQLAAQGVVDGEMQHARTMEAGERQHEQALEQGEQGNVHKIEQIKATPRPAPGKPKK